MGGGSNGGWQQWGMRSSLNFTAISQSPGLINESFINEGALINRGRMRGLGDGRNGGSMGNGIKGGCQWGKSMGKIHGG